MTQVDLGLTGLTRLIRSLALMTVIKNLGRHSLPPLRRISSRDSKLQGEVRNGYGLRCYLRNSVGFAPLEGLACCC
jgi:hypothetical protein